jgi:hypothetical protein
MLLFRKMLHCNDVLAHTIDVQEPALQPSAFDLDMLGELVVTLEGARSNAAVAKPR